MMINPFLSLKSLILLSTLGLSFFWGTKLGAGEIVRVDRLQEVPCQTFNVPQGVINAHCAYLTVPENHRLPNGKTLKLGVIILKSLTNSPRTTPLFMEQGGPGASTLTRTRFFTPNGLHLPLQQERDIILVEQRGAIYTQPPLDCDNVSAIICHQILRDKRVNLNAFNMVENANDMVAVADALGSETFDFYGTSYGSLLAQYLIRQYPQRLRSVILDGVVPVDVSIDAYKEHSLSYALRQMFDTCKNDPVCDGHYPHLEQVFLDLLDHLTHLDRQITLITLNAKAGAITLSLDSNFLKTFVRETLYLAHLFVPSLPKLIDELAQGKGYGNLEQLYQKLEAESVSFANGMRLAMVCASRNFPQVTLDFPSPFPPWESLVDPNFIQQFCETNFPVEVLPPEVYQPINSDLPVLILNGQYDPVTPLPLGQWVARHLTRAYIYQYPGLGHGVLAQHPCPVAMVLQFLRTPQTQPKAECITEMGTKFKYN